MPTTESLAAEVAALRERLERLERDVIAGGANRKITLKEVASRLRHAPSTIRAWSKDPDRVRQYRLDLLLITSLLPNCEVYSTPRLLAQWEDAIREQFTRTLYGGGLRPGERVYGERRR
ncbi:MAG: hypothetical protein ACYC4P_07200 [Thermoanaerobaculia bacterium]